MSQRAVIGAGMAVVRSSSAHPIRLGLLGRPRSAAGEAPRRQLAYPPKLGGQSASRRPLDAITARLMGSQAVWLGAR